MPPGPPTGPTEGTHAATSAWRRRHTWCPAALWRRNPAVPRPSSSLLLLRVGLLKLFPDLVAALAPPLLHRRRPRLHRRSPLHHRLDRRPDDIGGERCSLTGIRG